MIISLLKVRTELLSPHGSLNTNGPSPQDRQNQGEEVVIYVANFNIICAMGVERRDTKVVPYSSELKR